MTLTVPASLAWMLQRLSLRWPEADEDAMFEEANVWEAFAAALIDLDTGLHVTVRDVAQNNAGHGVDALEHDWLREHANVELCAEASTLMGVLLNSSGTAVQLTKIWLLVVLKTTAQRIIAAEQLRSATLGASEMAVASAIRDGQTHALEILRDLRRTAEEMLTGTLRHKIEDLLANIQRSGPPPGATTR